MPSLVPSDERRRQGERARRQPLKGREHSRKRNPHEGGDNRTWRRKPRAGRRRLARSANSLSRRIKGGHRGPLFNFCRLIDQPPTTKTTTNNERPTTCDSDDE